MAFAYLYQGYRVMITRRSNAVQLKLRYTPGRGYFDLTVPPGCGKKPIDEFLSQSRTWMDTMLEREGHYWTPGLAAGERAWLGGQQVTLGRDGIPTGTDFLRLRNQRLQDTLKRLLERWCPRMNVKVNRVTLRDMSSKWGSCMVRDHNISINVKLGAMPERLTEYVLVHELNHLHHPDHSRAFYADMTLLLPDWAQRKKELNEFG